MLVSFNTLRFIYGDVSINGKKNIFEPLKFPHLILKNERILTQKNMMDLPICSQWKRRWTSHSNGIS